MENAIVTRSVPNPFSVYIKSQRPTPLPSSPYIDQGPHFVTFASDANYNKPRSMYFAPFVAAFELLAIATRAKSSQYPFHFNEYPAPSLPVSNATKSFWVYSDGANPLATYGSEGPLTSDADICIIGSGITGVSAAHVLFESEFKDIGRKLNVVILEARDFCSGATGRNGGHLTANPFRGFSKDLDTYGLSEAIRSIAIENHTVSVLRDILVSLDMASEVDFVPGKRVFLLTTEGDSWDSRHDWEVAKHNGVPVDAVEWANKDVMIERYKTPYPAVLHPGNTLWPLKLVTHLYNVASFRIDSTINLGLHTHTPVKSVTPIHSPSAVHDLPRRQTLHTPRGNITCTSVLHATNGYAAYLLPHMHGAGPHAIVPTRGQMITLRVPQNASIYRRNQALSWITPWEYWFARKTKPDNVRPLVMLGGRRDASQSEPPFETYSSDDSELNTDVGRKLRESLPRTFLDLREEDLEVKWEWAKFSLAERDLCLKTGIMGYTQMKDPFVGPVLTPFAFSGGVQVDDQEHEGEFVAAGYTGHGMPRAYGSAEVIAQIMLDELSGLHDCSRSVGWKEKWEKERASIEDRLPEWFPRRYLTWNRLG